MPIYEFVCNQCGSSFEKRVSFTATPPTCGACSSGNVQRKLSTPAIHFKGSGWYVNDSKKRNSAAAASSADR